MRKQYMLNERNPFERKDYILYVPNYITFWKRQKYKYDKKECNSERKQRGPEE